MRSKTVALLLALTASSSLACATGYRPGQPSWVAKPPRGFENDFFVGEGVASSAVEAKQGAVANALKRISQRDSVRFSYSDSIGQEVVTVRDQRSQAFSVEQRQNTQFVTNGSVADVKNVRVVEEFADFSSGRALSWVLVSTPKRTGVRRVPTRAEAVLRSVVLPGWGQYTIGHERAGLAIGAGVLIAAPAGFALLSAQRQNQRLADATLIQASRIKYTNRANVLGVSANVTLAAAASAWVFSVVNATSAPFKLYVDASPASPAFRVQFEVAQWLQPKRSAVDSGGGDQ